MRDWYLISIIVLMAWIFYPLSITLADNGNYQNFLVGDRAAGMGGAVVASTRDMDACYYNPSGLARVTGSRISLSATLYGIYNIWAKEALGPGKSYKAREFESIPSAFGSILNVSDRFSLAFAVLTPDEIDYNAQKSFERYPYQPGILQSDYYSVTLDDTMMWIGPSLGFRASDRLSLGMAAYVVYRSSVRKQAWTYLYTKEGSKEVVQVLSRQYSIDYTNYGLLGILGAQYMLTDDIYLGATVQTPSLNLTGNGDLFYAAALDNPEQDELVNAKNMKSKNKLSTKFSAGIGYRVPSRYGFELDITHYFPTNYTELTGDDTWTGEQVSLGVRKKSVTNFNIGGEYYINECYPLRLGFFTNLSAAPYPDPEENVISRQIDMYGVSAGIGMETEHTTINLGINYVWGDGKSQGLDEDFNPTVVDARESYLFVFLASAYIF